LIGGLLYALGLFEGFDSAGFGGSEDQSGAGSRVQVPNLHWSTTAETDLADANLVLGQRYEVSSDTVPTNVVIYSDPAEETEVEEGSTVDIYVSTGPAAPPLPAPQPVVQQPAAPQPAAPQLDPEQAAEARKEAREERQDRSEDREKGKGKGENK
jgi:hypothetical protein